MTDPRSSRSHARIWLRVAAALLSLLLLGGGTLSGGSVPANAALPDVSCGTVSGNDATVASQLNTVLTGSLRGAMNSYRVSCARAIIRAIQARGLPSRASVIAITTAIVESTLRNNPNQVDFDSVGLFQQRASWGSTSQRLDPNWATNAFLNKMLSSYPNNSWLTPPVGAVCQSVQGSAYPERYSLQVEDAQKIVNALGSGGGGVLHEVYGNSTGWQDGSLGVQVEAFSAVSMGGSSHATTMAMESGYLYQVYADGTGWHNGNTGIALPAGTSLSAVNMGGQWPQVMAVENGFLYQIWGDTSGWHNASTGIAAHTVSAVNMGRQWPVAITLKAGTLHEVYGDASGWHDGNIGISADKISAVNMLGSHAQVMAVRGGFLHQIYGDNSGWHDGNVGITANDVSAANTGGQWPLAMTVV